MDEKNLLKVALICGLIGIFIILILSNNLEPSSTKISDISSSFVDQTVKIQGELSSIKITSSVVMLDIKDDTGVIKVVSFDQDILDLNKGETVEIIGDVTEYKGVLEIEAKSIKSV